MRNTRNYISDIKCIYTNIIYVIIIIWSFPITRIQSAAVVIIIIDIITVTGNLNLRISVLSGNYFVQRNSTTVFKIRLQRNIIIFFLRFSYHSLDDLCRTKYYLNFAFLQILFIIRQNVHYFKYITKQQKKPSLLTVFEFK